MAVRLQMRLGVVAESDRLPDSPDRIVVVEPSVGSVARSKGSLYLLVTSSASSGRAREATRLVAEAIRDQYYYDESAGIRVCIVKAISAANKRLAHQRERFGVPVDAAGNGPIGVAVAVVRSNELYVATVGPAEAYLIRQARLSTLPDPHRERGLPTGEVEPEVWRGEIGVGDSLVLISPNVVERLGADELKDAMVTLHPQSAMEQLQHQFVAADGSGSDGALAVEANEVAATTKQRTLVPVRPPEPLAGAPDRSPIPLAASVSGGVAAVQAGARQARSAAGGFVSRIVWRIQDLLPARGPRYRKVTPLSAQRETQRRAAVAVLALVALVAVFGLAVYMIGFGPKKTELSSLSAGQQALQQAESDVGQVFGPGIDLVADDQPKALQLLTDAYNQLQVAESGGIATSRIDPLRSQVIAGLDRIWNVVPIAARSAFAFPDSKTPVNLTAVVRGPDGAPYVLDSGSKTVYRIDLQARKATVILRAGQTTANGTKVAEPKFIAVGGPDLLILDAKNTLWRWRPADNKGNGTLLTVRVSGATSWGSDIRGIGTYLREPDAGLYNLYVIDPSQRQVLRYSPAADGSGYPADATGYLATAQDVSGVSEMLIDGDMYLVDNGAIERLAGGRTVTWSASAPGDALLRTAPRFLHIASPSGRGEGVLYAWDAANARVIAYDKATGNYQEQYRLAGGLSGFSDVRGMYVTLGAQGDPPTLWWVIRNRLLTAPLVAVPDQPSASPSPSPQPSPSPRSSGAASTSRPSKASASPSASHS